jgi:hypothetical protein
MSKLKYIPKGCFWSEEKQTLYMTRCPKCERENYAVAVAAGICAWCNWDVNMGNYNIKKEDKNEEIK